MKTLNALGPETTQDEERITFSKRDLGLEGVETVNLDQFVIALVNLLTENLTEEARNTDNQNVVVSFGLPQIYQAEENTLYERHHWNVFAYRTIEKKALNPKDF